MATATTGLGNAAYNETLKKAQNEKTVAEYKEVIAKYEAQREEVVTLMRAQRKFHVDHLAFRGIECVAASVQSLKYELENVDRTISDYKKSLIRLEGAAPASDNDD